MVKRFIFINLFIAAVLCPLAAQAIESVTVSPNPVGRGDLFTMVVIVDHDSSTDVEFPLKELPEQFERRRGPYIRSFIDSSKDDESRRKVRITTTFRSRHSGRMIIPELNVVVAGKTLKTDPVLMRIGLYKNRKLYLPLEVEWIPAFNDIYAGEAVPVFLVVKNQEVVSLYDRTRVEIPRDGFFEKAEGLGKIETGGIGDVFLYDVPAASYIYTSPVAGRVKIPSAGVDKDGITGWTDNLYLTIKPVPEKISATGAVGKFNFITGLNTEKITSREELVFTASVEGTGNLNFLKIPEPEVSGLLLLSRTEQQDYNKHILGYSGRKVVAWTFTSNDSGEAEITIPEFSYLNKESGIIETFPEKKYVIDVVAAKNDGVVDDSKEFPFTPIGTAQGDGFQWQNHYSQPGNYIWFFPALIFYIFYRILKKKRILISFIITVIIMVAGVSVLDTFGSFSGDDEKVKTSTYYYNAGIEYYNKGCVTDSLHALRTAVYTAPMNSLYYDTLKWVEEEEGFPSYVEPSVKIHPDLFFYLLIASVNFFFSLAFLKRYRSSGAVLTAFLFSALTIIVFAGISVYSHFSRDSLTGIVAVENAYLKKIPRKNASDWLSIESGTSMKIIDDTEGYFLIETGMGVKGWIDCDSVIKDRPD